ALGGSKGGSGGGTRRTRGRAGQCPDRSWDLPSRRPDHPTEKTRAVMLAEDAHADLKRFYELVTALPEHDRSSRWKEQDWRVFGRDEQTPVAELYRDLTDGGNDLQRINGAPWGRIMGVPGLTCKVSTHRARVGIRFRGQTDRP